MAVESLINYAFIRDEISLRHLTRVNILKDIFTTNSRQHTFTSIESAQCSETIFTIRDLSGDVMAQIDGSKTNIKLKGDLRNNINNLSVLKENKTTTWPRES